MNSRSQRAFESQGRWLFNEFNGLSKNEAVLSDQGVVFQPVQTIPLYISILSLIYLLSQWIVLAHNKRKGFEQRQYNFDIPGLKRNLVIFRVLETFRLIISAVLNLLTIAFPNIRGDYWFLPIVVSITIFLSLVVLYTSPSRMSPSYAVTIISASCLVLLFSRDAIPLLFAPTLPASILTKPDGRTWTVHGLFFLNSVIIPGALPHFMKYSDPTKIDAPPPSQMASFWSFIFYIFIDPLVRVAYKKKSLTVDDLPPTLEREKAQAVKEAAYPYLDPTISGQTKPGVLWPLLKYIKWELLGMLATFAIKTVNDFSGPIATLNILRYLESPDHGGLVQPWVWIVWLTIGPIISSLSEDWSIYIRTHTIVRVEVAFSQLILDHTMRIRLNTASADLPNKERKNTKKGEHKDANVEPTPHHNGSDVASTSTSSSATKVDGTNKTTDTNKVSSNQAGSISNLLTVDLKNLIDLILVHGAFTVIKLITSFVILYQILGWSSLVGFGILLISVPLPAYLIKLRKDIQKNQMKKADERLQAVTQVMNVVRMIKLFGWETKSKEKVGEKRQAELRYVWLSELLDTGSGYVVQLFPIMAMLGTYTCFTLIAKQPLRASLIFSSISLFDTLRQNMFEIIYYVPRYIKGKVAADRIGAFLASGETLSTPVIAPEIPSNAIVISNSEFTWSSGNSVTPNGQEGERQFSLRINGQLEFVPGKVNLITGPTGCGKTSLLMSLLGEMIHKPTAEDSWFILPRDGGVAYAAQESWVLNETIRENILFGSEYDDDRYQKVLRQTALYKDLEMFEAGDLTEVGEKGVTMSGGQKARITLARALYSKARILLLDDILSALDVHTAAWVVEECLGGDLIRGRTVLLVTHNVLLAKSVADYIVLLSANGTIKSHGPVEDVIRRESAFHDSSSLAETSELNEAGKEVDVAAEDKAQAKKSGKLIVAEEVALGHIGWQTYKLYLTRLGGPFFYIPAYISMVILAFMPIVQKAFLAYWSNQYETMPVEEVPVRQNLAFYGLLALFGSLIGFGSFVLWMIGIIRASTLIHKELINSIMSSTLRWLDTTPISRVIARCSQDMNAIDNEIPNLLIAVVTMASQIILTAVTVVAVCGPQMLIPAVAIVVLGITLGHIYMTAQLPVKRLMSNAKAPILAHVQTALLGLVSVRAYGAQDAFRKEMRKRMDTYSVIAYPFYDLNRWVDVRVQCLGGIFSGLVATWLIYGNYTAGGAIGFTLVLVSGFNQTLLWLVRLYNSLEVEANSLERVRDFLAIEHEPKPTEDGNPPAYWPASSSLKVERLCARYSQDGPLVLDDLTFNINPGERVGVVGRTGAGKSSLGLALLRAIPTTGSVQFDGLDVSKINLEALRSNISIIPQSPDLLAGTLRENLDPVGEHDDVVLNDALNQAGMSHLRVEGETSHRDIGLDTTVENGGSNFSQGQRQIIALARAFVRKTKILIMDEATAAIDYETDNMIQQFIRSEFKDVTIITIAHRLRTIMNSDKILVLDEGRIKEFGSPKELLQISSGGFKSLVDESPDKVELYGVANADPSLRLA